MYGVATIKRYADLVVLPHSVFALPFALAAFLLAIREAVLPFDRTLVGKGITVILAVVFARTAAMAFNRFIDWRIDAKNPRTAQREIPQGVVTPHNALMLVIGSSLAFLICAGALGAHCLALAPFVLVVLLGYSVTKRFTSLAHVALGLALGLAPGGAWWVIRPHVEALPLLLIVGVTLWVAGFDILYSCQDEEFDRQEGLHSIPQRFGIHRALNVARVLHLVSFVLFLSVGVVGELPNLYFGGMALIGGLLGYQHTLVSANDLSKINRAFFTTNGVISLGYFLLIVLCLVAESRIHQLG